MGGGTGLEVKRKGRNGRKRKRKRKTGREQREMDE